MSLKLPTYTTPQGIVVQDAIAKIFQVTVNSNSGLVMMNIYADVNKEPFEYRTATMPYNLNGANALSQAYAYVKTLPGFENAIDV